MDWCLLRQSLTIRVSFIALQFVANTLLPDHQSDGFSAPRPPDQVTPRPLDAAVTTLLGGLHRWDAQYLLHVAEHGYTHESTLAFLPGWPALVRTAAAPLSGLLSPGPALLLAAVLLTTALSAAAAQALLALSLAVLPRPAVARTAAALFCWSPATVFLTAPYSESLFACLSFAGLLLCRRRLLWGAAAAFGLAAATRSNGLVLAGFLVCAVAEDQLRFMFPPAVKENTSRPSAGRLLAAGCRRLLLACVLCLLVLVPLCLHQVHVFQLFCSGRPPPPPAPHVHHFLAAGDHVIPADRRAVWCLRWPPLSYGYVQQHYWGVGLLRYWHWRQIPNFLLATPMALLVLHGAAIYLRRLVLQLRGRPTGGATADPTMLPYMLHAAALTMFMIGCAHVQVVTRLLAAGSPVPYWLAAEWLHGSDSTGAALATQEDADSDVDRLQRQTQQRSGTTAAAQGYADSAQDRRQRQTQQRSVATAVRLFFISYAVAGTALFANNLPWT